MKTVVVQAQQKWESLSINRFSDMALCFAVNEAGQQGWELVSVVCNKDMKGSNVWTAFMRRPCAAHAPVKSDETAGHSAGPQEVHSAHSGGDTPGGWDLSGDAFEVKKDE